MSAPVPDTGRRVLPPAPGSQRCGSCEGIEVETPQALANRDGLSAIAYRIGDHAQFRASLHAALSSSKYAPLAPHPSLPVPAGLGTRDDSDFTIGLIDAFACMADVLTFYQERIANESYLRTALERVSLQELGKLVGYRPRPGVAAETWLAVALEAPPKPPAALAAEPGSFGSGVPARVALDAGLKVQSIPGPGEQPQTFESVEALAEARPEWNALRPWFSEVRRPTNEDTDTYLAGVNTGLEPGDALVFVGADPSQDGNWEFRVLEHVEVQREAGRTRVSWKRPLGFTLPFADVDRQVYALRRRAAVYGHNAPDWHGMSVEFRSAYPAGVLPNGTSAPDWPDFLLAPSGFPPAADRGYVDLDGVYADVQSGSLVVLAKGAFNYPQDPIPPGAAVDIFSVGSIAESSRSNFALSGKVTRLELRGNVDLFKDTPRQISVFAVSEQLAYAEYPVTGAVAGSRIPIAGNVESLQPGRRLIVRGTTPAGESVVVASTLVAIVPHGNQRELELNPPLPAALARDSVIVHANVVLASHGESVSQLLGAGNASAAFQRFELNQLPLTHRAAATESGSRSELAVRVGNVAWSERATLHGAPPSERAYTLGQDEHGRLEVLFGDGVQGARLPSGVNNVRAHYRKGLGAGGNVGSEKLTQLLTRPLGVKGVSNPLPAEGGTDPESAQGARANIPVTTRTLGRAVSVLDYEDFARGFSGIAKARAQVLQLPTGPTVAITIAAPGGAALGAASPLWQSLFEALRTHADPHVAVQLLACELSTFQLGLRVKRDPAYEQAQVFSALEARLRERYSFAQSELGQPVQSSELIAVAQSVPGVVAVDLTALYGGSAAWLQAFPFKRARLLASCMRVSQGVARPAELLTLDPGPLAKLEEMP